MTISRRIYANNAKTTIASPIGTTDTSITVSDGSKFPSPGTGEYFLATLESAGTIEIVKVSQRSGNIFSGITRAQEGTVAASFLAGTRIDNRITRDTSASYVTKLDTAVELASVDLLDSPINSTSNNYFCHSNDTSGNPIIAIRNNDTSWRFVSHRLIQVSGAAETGSTTTSVTSNASVPTGLASVVASKYIIQFTTGANAGLARMVTSSGTGTVSWLTALPSTPSVGDQFQVYISDTSIINDLINSSDDGLIYSILLSS